APPIAAPPVPAPTAAAVAAALARIPCSALAADVRAGGVAVQGFVSRAVGTAGVREPLLAMSGMPAVHLAVREVDPGMCRVLSTFAPYWIAHRQAGGGTGLRLAGAGKTTTTAGATLAAGDSLMVDVTTPATASFMTVDAYSPDAGVIHLLPNALALDNRAPPGHRATIGRPGDWTIGKSAGSGLIVVLVTTPEPLFATLRRESEPSPEYLAEVAKNLARMRAQSGAGKGAGKIGVEFLPVATR
ncbi:MAG: protein kinase, partial [Massilia sp.]|nr:protein kinase [Massilia sp.]